MHRLLGRLSQARQALAATEFAIAAPVLLIMMIAVYDFGMGQWHHMQVTNAARAGAAFAGTHEWNSAAIALSVTDATDYPAIQATPAPEQYCGCPNATAGITTVACGSTCPSGGTAGTYVRVSATASYRFALRYPGVTTPWTLSATAIVRTK